MSKRLAVLGTSLAFAAALVLPLSASALTPPYTGGGLTEAQKSVIISLLESFGASSSVIANVTVALGGTTTPTSNFCRTFADLKYGNFDDAPGGRVSQLQALLGIPSSTFGFGTYGARTRAAWQRQCVAIDPPLPPYANFSALPSAGSAPLHVTFKLSNYMAGALQIDFGDGVTQNTDDSCLMGADCKEPYVRSHTYASTGTYNVRLIADGKVARTANVTVTSDNKTPTCTLDVTTSRGVTKTGLTGTGYYDGSGSTYVEINEGGWVRITWHSTGAHYATGPDGNPLPITAKDLTWGSSTYYPSGQRAYELAFYGNVDATDAPATKCGVMVEILQSKPSATIDVGSLTQTSNTVSISGGATNTSRVLLALEDRNYAGSRDYSAVSSDSVLQKTGYYLSTAPISVINGRWVSPQIYEANGTYLVLVYDWASKTLLTTGTLTVTATKAPTCTLDVTTSEGVTKTGLTGTGYYDGSGSTYVEIHEGEWVKVKWHSTNANYAKGPGGDRYLANDSGTFYPGGQKAYEWMFFGSYGSEVECGVMVEILQSKPSATIDASSLTTSSSTPIITGSAKTPYLSVSVYGSDGEKSAYNSELTVSVVNGRWSTKPLSYLPPGTYTVKVYDTAKGDTLTSGTLTVTGAVF